jgi:hypothetical protein
MLGLSRTASTTAAQHLNLEGVITALLACLVYRENLDRRIALGMAAHVGGGRTGLMGVVADAALEAGGRVIGVIPHAMISRELAHDGLQDLRVVASMHERKAMMAELSDAFIAAPGGFGTFEELCEAINWTQLGLHRKRCGLLNVEQFYDPLLQLVERAVDDGFIRPDSSQIIVSERDPAALNVEQDRIVSKRVDTENCGGVPVLRGERGGQIVDRRRKLACVKTVGIEPRHTDRAHLDGSGRALDLCVAGSGKPKFPRHVIIQRRAIGPAVDQEPVRSLAVDGALDESDGVADHALGHRRRGNGDAD